MSFDVVLMRFAEGDLAQVDRPPVREVIRAAKYRGPDAFGFYVIEFSDGLEVELSAKGLELEESFTGCTFHIRSSGDGLMNFIFDVARAGDMVILPAMEGNPLILVSEPQKKNIPDDLKDFQSIIVNSAGELSAVLNGGFGGWSAYRNQVLRQSRAAGEA